jgi:YD repeat-containing protein
MNDVTTRLLHQHGRPTQQVNADSDVTPWSLDSAGRVTSTTDDIGHTATSSRYSLGYVTTVIHRRRRQGRGGARSRRILTLLHIASRR